MLTVTGVLIGTELSVFVDDGDDVSVQNDPATGNVQVIANGSPATAIPSVQSSVLTALNVFAGSDDNVLDVSAVSAADFGSLSTSGSISIESGDGNDRITGSDDFAESIRGGDGNDTIDGQGGDDTIDGGDGNDLITGGLGADSLDGDDGNDTIDGGDGGDNIDAGDGADSVTGGSGMDTIDAGQGADFVDGGDDDDTINGMSGNDTILGGLGNDVILGGSEHDSINGGNGNDALDGQGGHDTLDGEAGDDSINGSAGNDSIDGGAGDDFVNAGSGRDTAQGGADDDTVLGGGGNDSLAGDSLSPLFIVFGDDRVRGQGGDDTINGGGEADFLDGGAGNDLIRSDDVAAPSAASTVQLTISDLDIIPEGNPTASEVFYPIAPGAVRASATGDFDLDGAIDIAILVDRSTSASVSVLYNNGDGTFSAPVVSLLTSSPVEDIVAADLNGDGLLDLAITDSITGAGAPREGRILFNAGSRQFNPESTVVYNPTAGNPFGIEAADVNGDGFVDLVVAAAFQIDVVFNDGTGAFPTGTTLAVLGQARVLSLDDLNNDGNIDILAGDLLNAGVAAFLGDGSGAFAPALSSPIGAVQIGSYGTLDTGDIDGDGDPDVAAVNRTTGSVIVSRNSGNATFSGTSNLIVPGFATSVAFADFDDDGFLDLFATTRTGDNLSLFLNAGNGTFPGRIDIPIATGVAREVSVIDLDGDSELDVAVTSSAPANGVSVFLGNSGSTVERTVDVSLSTPSTTAVTVDFTTADGIATSDVDYRPISGTLTFPPGTLTQQITVTSFADNLAEGDENFLINLSNAVGASIEDSQGQVTIGDDDGGISGPTLSIDDVSVTPEGGAGTTTSATFTVSLSAASTSTITVELETGDVTTLADSDYGSSQKKRNIDIESSC